MFITIQKRWLTRKTIPILIGLPVALLLNTVVNANHGITIDSVIIGGIQSPSSTVNHTWDGALCRTGARVYVRWYVTAVNSSRVYVDKVYFSYRPNANGTLYGYRLVDGNRNEIQSQFLAYNAPANRTTSHTAQVDKWIDWGGNKFINFDIQYDAARIPTNASYPCGARSIDSYALELR